ncbi:MAG: flagellar hook-associated protein FlgL [Burkholderiales bacterium]|nr:flagellar hook-associated protein FlgL [Burkholderiales bacterium]
MALTNLTRTATADAYGSSLLRLSSRQNALVNMQENMTAGKRVVRASDDPAAAAQAERARTRMARIDTDQRVLETQRNALTEAESTLGSAGTLMQRLRELVVKGGNTGLSSADRQSVAQEMRSLRDQILALANTRDVNGQPLFGGLGSASTPFVDAAGGVVYDALSGQAAATPTTVPATLDGFSTWMNVPQGNGVFTVAQAAGTSQVWSDAGRVTDPSALTGHNYSIAFTVTGGVTTYTVTDLTTATAVVAGQPYTAGQDVTFDGMTLKLQGTPANGEALTLGPAGTDSVFGVMDRAIAAVEAGGHAGGTIAHDVARSLTEVDAAMARVSSARGQAGELLSRADIITNQQSGRKIQLEADRARAEDLDMVKALSDFNTQQTAYSVALQTYAQIQKLSLFNYIG